MRLPSASGAGARHSPRRASRRRRSCAETGPSASGHEQTARLTDATAIFAANDQMALGVLRALAEAGRRVPEDVAVIGFDDIADAADYSPPLSTVRQDFDALGEQAVQALIADIEGAAVPEPGLTTPELILRTSA
ncbi:substrate-binding domain-containing protein [Microbacterium sp. KUDC0406]|nr:substrate-binding domain-containing protein [Microbacterium sp. KUDC0406]UJP10083.1 substrate-binding domain-containing protein [Microbacterium sp. KUDC0406]